MPTTTRHYNDTCPGWHAAALNDRGGGVANWNATKQDLLTKVDPKMMR